MTNISFNVYIYIIVHRYTNSMYIDVLLLLRNELDHDE